VAIVKNDLYDYGLFIYQDDKRFKFSLDSILLAEFVNIDKNTKYIVDFCTGNAPVPLILSTKYAGNIVGIELQKYIYDLGCKSILTNKLNNRLELINDNIKNVNNYIESESVDIVTCNPPYFKYEKNSLINDNREKAIARHEIEMSLEDIMISARYILKNKGELYIVHRSDRLQEIVNVLSNYKFAIKKIQFVCTGGNVSNIVLIKAIKNGNYGSLKVFKEVDVSNVNTYKGIFG